MTWRRVTVALAATWLLSACAGRMVRPPQLPPAVDAVAIAAAQAAQDKRIAWLDAHPQWGLSGRIAISNAGKGGSGRIDWQQRGDRYEVSLSAPVTRQSWRIAVGPEGARLEGLEGGTREGADPAQLLLEATGWQIPVAALADWARGRATPGIDIDAMTYATDAHLQSLRQDGWRIDYLLWQPPVGAQPALPARIDAQRGDAKVRLIIDHWDFSAQ